MARILIIEDEHALRTTLESFLAREGHEVIAVADGREAFDRALAAAPDVIVADWMLENHIHGLHVAETFKAINPDLHIILITGFPSEDLVAESQRCGVFELLPKPFGLDALRDLIDGAVAADRAPGRVRPIAVLEVGREGSIRFASTRTRELFAQAGLRNRPDQLEEIFDPDEVGTLLPPPGEWVPVDHRRQRGGRWLVRGRRNESADGYWMVLCPEEEPAGTTDPRVRILLDYWSRSRPVLSDHGPVVVVEKDGSVRRLLVSQIERLGSLCYATDDLEAALRLIAAEPRVETVLIDIALAGDLTEQWVRRISVARPGAAIIGTGGSGTERELRALGLQRVLRKPWRLNELLDAIAPTAVRPEAGIQPSGALAS